MPSKTGEGRNYDDTNYEKDAVGGLIAVVVLGVSVVASQTAPPPQAAGKSAAPGAAVVVPKDLVDLNSATVDQLSYSRPTEGASGNR
jgi:hypothetical protein